MTKTYDAVIVGARCAGAPTAMLLARKGYDVMLVDRASFPSDTLSSHFLHQAGAAALARWGLLDELVATDVPPVAKTTLDLGPIKISGRARPAPGAETAFGPRRIVLDKILVDAAARAGAEVREKFTVDGLLRNGTSVTGISAHGEEIKARIVIGAD